MILGPIALFRATCKNFLFLAVWAPGPRFRFRARIVDPCDILSLLDLFRNDLAKFTIFSRLSTKVRMSILIAYSDPLRKNKFNEYKFKGIQTTFYF
jgi:hypothetical protein